jgi:hypothetical protein
MFPAAQLQNDLHMLCMVALLLPTLVVTPLLHKAAAGAHFTVHH